MFNMNPYSYNTLPVSSMKEAQNAPNDFSGNPVFYFNSSDNEVYLKRFDMTSGKILFGKYIFTPIEPEKKPEDELKTINEKLDYLYQMFEQRLDCRANAHNDGTIDDKTTKQKEKAVNNDE